MQFYILVPHEEFDIYLSAVYVLDGLLSEKEVNIVIILEHLDKVRS